MTQAHVALYGSIAMQRQRCKACDGMALVIDGKFACCDRPAPDRPAKVKRMVEADATRRRPSAERQAEILTAQQNRCLYCEVEFGSLVFRNKRAVWLRVEWDHVLPFVFSQSCHDKEFAAACHVCNGIKSATIYATLDDARTALALTREMKGWSF